MCCKLGTRAKGLASFLIFTGLLSVADSHSPGHTESPTHCRCGVSLCCERENTCLFLRFLTLLILGDSLPRKSSGLEDECQQTSPSGFSDKQLVVMSLGIPYCTHRTWRILPSKTPCGFLGFTRFFKIGSLEPRLWEFSQCSPSILSVLRNATL